MSSALKKVVCATVAQSAIAELPLIINDLQQSAQYDALKRALEG